MDLHRDDLVVYLFSRKHRAKSKLLVRDGPFGSSFGLDSEAQKVVEYRILRDVWIFHF